MRKTILMVVAVAGFSLLAVGQSDKKQAEKKHTDASAQTARGSYDVKKQEGSIQESPEASSEKKNIVHRDIAARDAQTGKATGKLQTISADDSTKPAATSATAQQASGHTVTSPRDSSTGMASGKRQSAPSPDTKKSSTDQPKK